MGGVVRFNVREQTALRADTPGSNCHPAAPHPSLAALGLCIRRRSYEFRMILFLLLAEDHEEDGGNADDDADEDDAYRQFLRQRENLGQSPCQQRLRRRKVFEIGSSFLRDMQKKLRISKKSSNFAGVFENRL